MRPGIDALRALPLFATLDPGQLARLNEVGDFARVGPHEDLFASETTPGEVNILVSGYVTTTHTDRKGNVGFTDVVVPVAAIGLAAAMLGLPSPMGARTMTTARLIVIPAQELRRMIDQDQRLCRQFLDHALREMHAVAAECQELKLRSSAQRLARYLVGLADRSELDPPRFMLPFEKRFLAARIGCSQENLSRAFALLRSYGVKTSQRGAIVIQDAAGLRAYAGLGPAAAPGIGPVPVGAIPRSHPG